ncbi:MAG: LysR family transcriptional regulator, partial [Clostridia bacterium]|nr:LysR family transcriptional regulator [Clostridia bacterium]
MSTLKQLSIFISVAEKLRMSEAAKALYVSQPTVSQTISDLEYELGVELFERGHKQLLLTPHGQLLLTHARKVMQQYEIMNAAVKDATPSRELRIGCTLSIANTML